MIISLGAYPHSRTNGSRLGQTYIQSHVGLEGWEASAGVLRRHALVGNNSREMFEASSRSERLLGATDTS